MNIMRLIVALIAIESRGNDNAIGDNGNAIGCLQIWNTCVQDVNQFSNTTFTHNDAYNRDKSITICRLYLQHYATHARLGHEPTFENMARIWNGGPNGYKKANTVKYWHKVKQQLRE